MKLPIDARLPELVALARDRNLVLVAEPGAGKTTRFPAAMLDEVERVWVIQPRRLAAKLASRFVAQSRESKLGDEVGYHVRYDRKTSKKTRLLFMTDGMALRKLHSSVERSESLPDVIIFDELHERRAAMDLALALVRKRQRGGEKVRIVAMSATLDAEPVAAFLDAEVATVEGRVFPVTTRHLPAEREERLERHVRRGIQAAIDDAPEGDILVFLPGAGEIRRAMRECQRLAKRENLELAPLYGELSASEQDRAVQKGKRRKVILSTNIAESSVTVQGVTAVVDAGLVRKAKVGAAGLSSLETVKASRASLDQRRGRAGRVREGYCVRLFTQADESRRQSADLPELQDSELADVLLSLLSMGHQPASLDWLSAPSERYLGEAKVLLQAIGAITIADDRLELTERGRSISRFPVHPRLGALIEAGVARDVGPRACLLAAMLGERTLRQGGEGHAFYSPASDALDILAELERFEHVGEPGSLHRMRAQSVFRARDQLLRNISPGRKASPENGLDEEEEALRESLLAAFPDRVATQESGRLILCGGGSAERDAGSVVRDAPWVLVLDARQRMGRKQVLGTMLSEIEPEWLLEFESIREVEETLFSETRKRVIRRSAIRYGVLSVDESESFDVDPVEAGKALATHIGEGRAARHFDIDAFDAYRQRLRFARENGFEAPEVDDSLGAVLAHACEGAASTNDLRKEGLVDALTRLIGYERKMELERFAPAFVQLPGRKRAPVTYSSAHEPFVSSRLQDFFGLRKGPHIAGGRVPLVLHLLAPNRRAVQVTKDLEGFWERHYPDIRKELKRRYSRHAWPEDPCASLPPKK